MVTYICQQPNNFVKDLVALLFVLWLNVFAEEPIDHFIFSRHEWLKYRQYTDLMLHAYQLA